MCFEGTIANSPLFKVIIFCISSRYRSNVVCQKGDVCYRNVYLTIIHIVTALQLQKVAAVNWQKMRCKFNLFWLAYSVNYPNKCAKNSKCDGNPHSHASRWNKFFSEICSVSRSLLKFGAVFHVKECQISYASRR